MHSASKRHVELNAKILVSNTSNRDKEDSFFSQNNFLFASKNH